MFVTVIHRIHDPEGFRPRRPRHSKLGFLPTLRCQSMRPPTITGSASASGKANRSTPCVRWLKARSDHGRTTSTTRCTWTDLRRSSESDGLIAATEIAVRRGSPARGPRSEVGTESTSANSSLSAQGVRHVAPEYPGAPLAGRGLLGVEPVPEPAGADHARAETLYPRPQTPVG